MIMALESSKQKLTSEFVKSKFLMENIKANSDGREIALVSKGKQHARKLNKPRWKCYKCCKIDPEDPEDPSKMVRARDFVFIENFGNYQNPVNNDTNMPLVLSQESSDEVQGDMVEEGES
ncbi:hypothetical protein JTB14_011231 [Gonioctena quinquepunctata]|nr:hypothetical protein JTB14_011231 [Gonioctena quinquepunctata]